MNRFKLHLHKSSVFSCSLGFTPYKISISFLSLYDEFDFQSHTYNQNISNTTTVISFRNLKLLGIIFPYFGWNDNARFLTDSN